MRPKVQCSIVRTGQRRLLRIYQHPQGAWTHKLSRTLSCEAFVGLLPKMPEPERESGTGREHHAEAAWQHWHKIGAPKLIVAPMVDQSELPFRMLCRKHGATAAYTPMLHSRLFVTNPKYRRDFTTCEEDRPLFVQFCANDPDTLLEAARIVAPHCDYVDINLGCPQGIAKRGRYGAFLMDDKPLIRALVSKLASNLSVPVSCKIRVFEELEETVKYAQMLEEAGCSVLAVHGRTRDQKNGKTFRADWNVIRAVKEAVNVPVIANGNIRWLGDVYECMQVTGVDGVMSAEALLENPALFCGHHILTDEELGQVEWSRVKEWVPNVAQELPTLSVFLDAAAHGNRGWEQCRLGIQPPDLLLEYLQFCDKYPVPMRMVRAHVHRMLGKWFRVHSDLRDDLNKQFSCSTGWISGMVLRMKDRGKDPPKLLLLGP